MKINNYSIELDKKAVAQAKVYKMAEIDLLEIIQEIDLNRVFLDFGFGSCYKYVRERLGLTKDIASNFICVARKSTELPQMKLAIRSGAVGVSTIRKITPVINKKNQEEWIQMAINLKQEDLEREVAKVSPKQAVPERANYISENRIKLQMGVNEETMKKFRHVQNLECQRQRKSVDLEETLAALIELYIEKKDPVRKAERIEARNNNKPYRGCISRIINKNSTINQDSNTKHAKEVKFKSKRVPLSASLMRAVDLRDKRQCSYEHENGQRCLEKKWLDYHHKLPVAQGGNNLPANIITLCSAHHRFVHSG